MAPPHRYRRYYWVLVVVASSLSCRPGASALGTSDLRGSAEASHATERGRENLVHPNDGRKTRQRVHLATQQQQLRSPHRRRVSTATIRQGPVEKIDSATKNDKRQVTPVVVGRTALSRAKQMVEEGQGDARRLGRRPRNGGKQKRQPPKRVRYVGTPEQETCRRTTCKIQKFTCFQECEIRWSRRRNPTMKNPNLARSRQTCKSDCLIDRFNCVDRCYTTQTVTSRSAGGTLVTTRVADPDKASCLAVKDPCKQRCSELPNKTHNKVSLCRKECHTKAAPVVDDCYELVDMIRAETENNNNSGGGGSITTPTEATATDAPTDPLIFGMG